MKLYALQLKDGSLKENFSNCPLLSRSHSYLETLRKMGFYSMQKSKVVEVEIVVRPKGEPRFSSTPKRGAPAAHNEGEKMAKAKVKEVKEAKKTAKPASRTKKATKGKC